jgi:hypothetical protein
MHNNQNLWLGFHWGPNVYAILVAIGPKVLDSAWFFGQELSLEDLILGRATDS